MGLPNTLTDGWCPEWVLCGSMSLLHITAGLLLGLWYSLNLKCSFHATICAIFLTAFFGVFWKDNLLSEWPRQLDPTKPFTRCDFALSAQGFDVYVCWSKAVLICQCTVFLLLSVYISHYFLLLQLDKFLPWPKEHQCIHKFFVGGNHATALTPHIECSCHSWSILLSAWLYHEPKIVVLLFVKEKLASQLHLWCHLIWCLLWVIGNQNQCFSKFADASLSKISSSTGFSCTFTITSYNFCILYILRTVFFT